MKYFAILLRIAIIAMGIHMMILGDFEPQTPLMCGGVSVTLIGVYLTLQSWFGPKSMLCPFTEKCREKMGCKSEK